MTKNPNQNNIDEVDQGIVVMQEEINSLDKNLDDNNVWSELITYEGTMPVMEKKQGREILLSPAENVDKKRIKEPSFFISSFVSFANFSERLTEHPLNWYFRYLEQKLIHNDLQSSQCWCHMAKTLWV